jgi:hemoglobin
MRDSSITESSIRAMVDRFYERVRKDAVLSPIFDRELAGKWDTHMPRMYAFWTKLLLGSGEFQGNVFGKHMALSGVDREHFVRWLALFRQTAHETYVEDDAREVIEVAERIAASIQLGYFGKRVV